MSMMACERCLRMSEQTFAYDSNGTMEEARHYCRECVLAALREDEIEEKLDRCECGGRLTYPWNDPAMVAQIFSEGLVFWECENAGNQSKEGADSFRHSFLGMYLAQAESDHDSPSDYVDWNG